MVLLLFVRLITLYFSISFLSLKNKHTRLLVVYKVAKNNISLAMGKSEIKGLQIIISNRNMKTYKVILSAKVYFYEEIEAKNLTEARKLAENEFLRGMYDQNAMPDPQDNFEISEVENVEYIRS